MDKLEKEQDKKTGKFVLKMWKEYPTIKPKIVTEIMHKTLKFLLKEQRRWNNVSR